MLTIINICRESLIKMALASAVCEKLLLAIMDIHRGSLIKMALASAEKGCCSPSLIYIMEVL